MKRSETRCDSATRSFYRIRRRRRLPSGHRSERSEPLDTASAASEAIKRDLLPASAKAGERHGLLGILQRIG
jgi:hypothetical protein